MILTYQGSGLFGSPFAFAVTSLPKRSCSTRKASRSWLKDGGSALSIIPWLEHTGLQELNNLWNASLPGQSSALLALYAKTTNNLVLPTILGSMDTS